MFVSLMSQAWLEKTMNRLTKQWSYVDQHIIYHFNELFYYIWRVWWRAAFWRNKSKSLCLFTNEWAYIVAYVLNLCVHMFMYVQIICIYLLFHYKESIITYASSNWTSTYALCGRSVLCRTTDLNSYEPETKYKPSSFTIIIIFVWKLMDSCHVVSHLHIYS